LVVASSAHATSKEASKESKERAAKKACLTGDTAKGVELLADLFIDTGDLNYIFNQGRCFEQNRRYEDAVGRFREYLVKGSHMSDDAKADAEKHIAICQSYLGKIEPAQPPLAVKPAAPPFATPQPATTTPPPSPTAVLEQVPEGSAGSGGSGLRIAGVVTASVGGAALLAGVILNIKVNSMSSDMEKLNNYNRSTDSTRKDYQMLGWISYGVGATCLASGALMYYLGWHKAHGSHVDVAVLPTVASGIAGAILTGAF
jgi:hypothetical protein